MPSVMRSISTFAAVVFAAAVCECVLCVQGLPHSGAHRGLIPGVSLPCAVRQPAHKVCLQQPAWRGQTATPAAAAVYLVQAQNRGLFDVTVPGSPGITRGHTKRVCVKDIVADVRGQVPQRRFAANHAVASVWCRSELSTFQETVMRHAAVPKAVEDVIHAMPHDAHPMAIILTGGWPEWLSPVPNSCLLPQWSSPVPNSCLLPEWLSPVPNSCLLSREASVVAAATSSE